MSAERAAREATSLPSACSLLASCYAGIRGCGGWQRPLGPPRAPAAAGHGAAPSAQSARRAAPRGARGPARPPGPAGSSLKPHRTSLMPQRSRSSLSACACGQVECAIIPYEHR